MLKWLDFKPTERNFKLLMKAYYNYYLYYVFKRSLKSDAYSIVFRLNKDEMRYLDRDDRIGERTMRMVFKMGYDWTNYHGRLLTEENKDEFYKVLYPWKRRLYKKYYKNECECFIWNIYEMIVCCTWSSFAKIEPHIKKDLCLDIPMGPNDLWGVDIVVHPYYQGRAFEFLLFKVTKYYLEEKGIENVWGAVYLGDRGSIRMHDRVGFKPVYLLHHRRRFGFKKSFLHPINEDTIKMANGEAEKFGYDLTFLWRKSKRYKH